jgi:tetratricopeptide (TPR) repeat protein
LLFDKGVATIDSSGLDPARKRLLALRAYAGVGAVGAARERWKDAQNAFETALKFEPDNLLINARLAQTIFKQGGKQNETKAYEIFQRMYNKSPAEAGRAEVNMANLYQVAGRDENALKLINMAVQRDPSTLKTQLAAAQFALDTGRLDLLRQCAAAVEKIDISSMQTQILLGFLARLDGDYAKAEAAFQKALDTSPTSPLALNQMAIALVEQTDEAKQTKAAEYAEMCNRLYADRTQMTGREAKITLAWVLLKQGRKGDAAQLVQQALSAGGVGPEAAYFAAVIISDVGQPEVAKVLLEQALTGNSRLFPNRSKAEQLLEELKAAKPAETKP